MKLFLSLAPQKAKVALVAFIGLHVPLFALIVYAVVTDFMALLPVLLVALLATLAGVAGTLIGLFAVLNLPESDVRDKDLTPV